MILSEFLSLRLRIPLKASSLDAASADFPFQNANFVFQSSNVGGGGGGTAMRSSGRRFFLDACDGILVQKSLC